MDNRPIGVFDSGVGGLTVVKEIKKLLPHESIVYLGDTARVPYGNRSEEIIAKFGLEDANFLLSKDVKCIVIACNTVSAYVAEQLRDELSVPVFDVIRPAATAAIIESRNHKVGVIGTRATINSGAYMKAILYGNRHFQVTQVSCPLFVPIVEEMEMETSIGLYVADKYLKDLAKSDIDVLILGCTHYPMLINSIVSIMGNNRKIINCGTEIAKELKAYLRKNSLLSDTSGESKYYVTDLTDRFVQIAEMCMEEKIGDKIERINIG